MAGQEGGCGEWVRGTGHGYSMIKQSGHLAASGPGVGCGESVPVLYEQTVRTLP